MIKLWINKWLIIMLRIARAITDLVIIYLSFYLGHKIYFINVPKVCATYQAELSPSLYYIPTADRSLLRLFYLSRQGFSNQTFFKKNLRYRINNQHIRNIGRKGGIQ